MNIKILVATHKAYWMPKDSAYIPLHVGCEGKMTLGYTGDNTGNHMSEKNPNYCELTGLYWAWKNLECEYIGLCHYRRYFAISGGGDKKERIMKLSDYERLLTQYDVILPKKRHYYIETVRSQYEHAHVKSDLDTAEQVLVELYPEYEAAFTAVMNQRSLYICNMFAMKKEKFDVYCQWLFDILFEVEKRIDISNYSVQNARVFGFLGERLFNVWLWHEQLKTVSVPVVFLEKQQWGRKIKSFLKRKFMKNKM